MTNIKLDTNKSFFAARVKLAVKSLKDIQLKDENKYALYRTYTGIFDGVESIKDINNLFDEIRNDSRREKRPINGFITLYWIPKGDYNINVPWGYRKGDYKINGTINFSIKRDDKIIMQLLQLPLWESVQADGVYFEYLSDYFIDNKGMQNGLSIWIREQTLPQIMDILDNIVDENRKNGTTITRENLSTALKKSHEEVSIILGGKTSCSDIDCIGCELEVANKE